MNKETIILDFDCTIVDSISAYCKVYNEIFNANANPNKITSWGMSEQCPLGDVEKIFASSLFFDYLEFMKDANEVIKNLCNKYNVIICSIGTPNNISNKSLWIKSNMPYIKDCIFIVNDGGKMDKSCIDMRNIKAFIDDNFENLMSSNCDSENKYCFGKVYDFNQNWSGDRLSNWKDIEKKFL